MINKFEESWLNKVLPNGLEHPSSTVISGPGGSGKPLIGFGIVYDWLKRGGNVIFTPLQYPKMKFVKTSLKKLYNLDVEDYSGRVGYIKFELEKDFEKEGNRIKTNLLKRNNWKRSINELEKAMGDNNTLVFASALNLLLFSPTYREDIVVELKEMVDNPKRSYLFAVSTNAFRDLVKEWEQVADNLFFTTMDEDMNLYLTTKEENPSQKVKVPLAKDNLRKIKKVALENRQRKIIKIKGK